MKNFIVIEGLDGSGKTTQTSLLVNRVRESGKTVVGLNFPDYDSESSTLVKMYLKGEIGGLDEVNIYAATSFYAADRYISYQTKWKEAYLAGNTIIADRYTTSNIIYQMAKLPKNQWEEYIEWIWDYEFTKLALPEPNAIIYLDVNPKVSRKLLDKRYQGDETKRDLHEANLEYLFSCREAALYAANKLGWRVITCSDEKKLLSIEEIAALIDNAFPWQ